MSRIKLEVWMRKGVQGAKQAFQFVQQPEKFLITTLVGTNIAIVAASSLMALYLEPYLSVFTITLISSVFLLFFGEILPKSIARDRATYFLVRSSFLLRGFFILLYPLIQCVMAFSRLFLGILGVGVENISTFFSRKDMEILIKEGAREGVVGERDSGLISRFVLRGGQKVGEIMIPRTEIVAVSCKESIKRALERFEKTGYSRIPVMGKNIDEILGLITIKDILLKRPRRVSQVIREIHFVPESANLSTLLQVMREQRRGMAIVVGEYGGTAGLVTLEDIVEEFFGEIQDEFDEESNLYRKIGPRQIDVNARVGIDELNARFGLNLKSGSYKTLGGLLIDRLKHIPHRGERLDEALCTLTVLSATHRKVNWVRIIKKEKGE